MLLWLQNHVETGEPSEKIVAQCLEYFALCIAGGASGRRRSLIIA